jgi:hypothetical protein
MKKFTFRHKEETWLTLTIEAYDLAVINIEKTGINISDYDYLP